MKELEKTQENQLAVIINESGLEKTKAQILLDNFSGYFELASDWDQKAKTLIVTNENQVAEMKMAREGRLFLRDKRVAIEKTRKELKDASLREGQTIDAIAKILKNLIEPIEEHLERQEKYREIKEKEFKEQRKAERVKILTELEFDYTYTDLLNMPDEQFDKLVIQLENEKSARLEAERKAEEERIAKEKAEAEERERIRIENEKLRKEAEEREKQIQKEREEAAKKEAELRAEQEAKLKAQKEEAERLAKIEAEKQAKIKAELEAKARKEAEEKAKLEAVLRANEEAERVEKERLAKIEKDRIYAEKKAMSAPDKVKLLAFADKINSLEIPELKTEEAKKILSDCLVLLEKTVNFTREKANNL